MRYCDHAYWDELSEFERERVEALANNVARGFNGSSGDMHDAAGTIGYAMVSLLKDSHSGRTD